MWRAQPPLEGGACPAPSWAVKWAPGRFSQSCHEDEHIRSQRLQAPLAFRNGRLLSFLLSRSCASRPHACASPIPPKERLLPQNGLSSRTGSDLVVVPVWGVWGCLPWASSGSPVSPFSRWFPEGPPFLSLESVLSLNFFFHVSFLGLKGIWSQIK